MNSALDLRTWLADAPAGWRMEIARKRVRHYYFRIYPKDRRVTISAPLRGSRRDLDAAVAAKSVWLLKKIAEAPRMPAADPDDRHGCRFRGKHYPVIRRTVDTTPRVDLRPDEGIVVRTRPGTPPEKTARLIDGWLRCRLKEEIQSLLDKWEPAMGVTASEFRIRRMKTRWGSCNTRARRIWINVSLIRLAPELLEYVLVHELAHLLEPSHNRRFYEIMASFLPEWKALKADLDRYSPL